jgi:hypothetical protein
MRRHQRLWICTVLALLAPAYLQAAAGPRDLSGAYRVAGKPAAVAAAAAPSSRRDCAPAFVAGVGAASTAHIVMGRDVMLIVHEANHTARHVHINGQHPADLQPSTFGHSIGWWEGDTLVVETVGLKSGQTVVERMRKVDNGRALEVIVNGRAMIAELRPDRRYAEDVCEVGGADSAAAEASAAPGAPAPARPLLEGVWQISQPVRMLRTSDGGSPPLRTEARKLHALRMELFKDGKAAEFNGSDACIPPGEPRTAHGGQPFEIVQGEDVIYFGYTWNRMLRMVYLGDAQRSDARPAYYGHWTGHWEGHALVLEGSGFRADTVLDATGLPHSEALHLSQRLSLGRSGNELEIRTTLDDPQTFTHSWSTVQRYRRLKDASIKEHICTPLTSAPAVGAPVVNKE